MSRFLPRHPARLNRIPVTPRKWQPTPRNIQVLAAVCALGTDDAAAAYLGISPRVVSQHVRLLMIGFHAVSRAQLCHMAHDLIAPHVE